MALLRKRPGSLRRRKTRLRSHGAIRCPLAGHQVGWCRGLCKPVDEHGLCGRIAPHGLRGRTQRAIAEYQERNRSRGGPNRNESTPGE